MLSYYYPYSHHEVDMHRLEEYSSVVSVIERLIEEENESIALYERAVHSLGDCVVKPLLISITQEKREHREMLERELNELNEQFALDEAIV
jgi:rubrerythrin